MEFNLGDAMFRPHRDSRRSVKGEITYLMILLSFLSCKYLETTFCGSRSEKLPFGHPVPGAHDIYLATIRCRLTLANPGQALDVYCSFRIDLIIDWNRYVTRIISLIMTNAEIYAL